MTSTAQRILAEALALSPDEREEIVDALSGSLEPVELSEQWQAEITARIAKIERGDAVLHDAEAHLRALQAKYSG